MKKVFQSVFNWLKMIFEEQKHASQKNTIAVLDGVRALAIVFVISYHVITMSPLGSWNWQAQPLAMAIATAGGSGVTLFFVLSGFLLFMPYAKALLTDSRWPLARIFYVRRALRIMPGYYLSLFILIILTQPDYFQPAHWANLGLFLSFFMDSSRLTFRLLNGPYWTLAVEWQFYMLLPLLMLGVLLLVRRVPLKNRLRAVTFCLGGIIICGLFVRFWGYYFEGNQDATFLVPRPALNVVLFFTFGIVGKYTEDFAVGMLASLCYIYAQSLPPGHRFVRILQRLSLWFWGVGIVILVFYAMWHFQSMEPAWPFLNALMPVSDWLSEMLLAWGYGLCVMGILFGPPVLQRPFTWLPLRWIGLISYSLYIWHLPLLVFFRAQVLPLWPGLNYFLAYSLYWVWVVVAIIPFCVLYYAFIERPGIKLGDRLRKQIEQRYRAKLSAPVTESPQPEPAIVGARSE
jgi:peptidoglycan/LPS O-acetylase OafA/YrhL